MKKQLLLILLISLCTNLSATSPYLAPNTLQFQNGSGWQVDASGNLTTIANRIIKVSGNISILELNNNDAADNYEFTTNSDLTVEGSINVSLGSKTQIASSPYLFDSNLALTTHGDNASYEMKHKDVAGSDSMLTFYEDARKTWINCQSGEQLRFSNSDQDIDSFLTIYPNDDMTIGKTASQGSTVINCAIDGNVSVGIYEAGDEDATAGAPLVFAGCHAGDTEYTQIFRYNVTAGGATELNISLHNDATSASGNHALDFIDINGQEASGGADGDSIFYRIDLEGTQYNPSDIKLKTNITPMKHTLNNLKKINGVYFNWKSIPSKKSVGCIAQNVEKVYPEIVKTMEDGYKSISYDKLTPIIIEATKTIHSKLNTNQQTIQKIKSLLKQMEQQ